MLLGTLDLLIPRTLLPGAAHGHTIAHIIERTSDEALAVDYLKGAPLKIRVASFIGGTVGLFGGLTARVTRWRSAASTVESRTTGRSVNPAKRRLER